MLPIGKIARAATQIRFTREEKIEPCISKPFPPTTRELGSLNAALRRIGVKQGVEIPDSVRRPVNVVRIPQAREALTLEELDHRAVVSEVNLLI